MNKAIKIILIGVTVGVVTGGVLIFGTIKYVDYREQKLLEKMTTFISEKFSPKKQQPEDLPKLPSWLGGNQ
jgi:hypothetical protein